MIIKMIFNLSKNVECPCDSGKKYKMCCIEKLSREHEEYYGLLNKEKIIKGKIVDWAMQNFSQDELDEYVYEFNGKTFEELKSDGKITEFFDWFFLESIHKEEGEKMLVVILNDFSDLFDQSEISIINEWINNTQSGIFEVKEIDKNNWRIILNEIFTNKKYKIKDRKASNYVIRGDILFARVQKIFDDYYVSGVVNTYPRFYLLDQIKNFINNQYELERQKNSDLSYEKFMNENSKVLNNFKPEQPKFLTPEKEDVKICEAVYLVNLDYINEILDCFEKDKRFLVTSREEEKGKFKLAEIAYLEPKNEKTIDNEKEIGAGLIFKNYYINEKGNRTETFGSIDIKESNLKVFSISENIFKEMKEILEINFEKYIKFIKEKKESVDSVLKKLEKKEHKQPKEEKGPEFKKMGEEIMEKYYKDWCDMKIPLFDNKTPRQIIKTKKGKEMLNKLLLDMENQEQHKKREVGEYIPVEKIIRDELDFYE